MEKGMRLRTYRNPIWYNIKSECLYGDSGWMPVQYCTLWQWTFHARNMHTHTHDACSLWSILAFHVPYAISPPTSSSPVHSAHSAQRCNKWAIITRIRWKIILVLHDEHHYSPAISMPLAQYDNDDDHHDQAMKRNSHSKKHILWVKLITNGFKLIFMFGVRILLIHRKLTVRSFQLVNIHSSHASTLMW